MNYFRVAFRLTRFICAMLYAGLDYWVRIWPKGSSLKARTAWGQKHGQSFINSLDVKVIQVGAPPKRGLMVSNHLSYKRASFRFDKSSTFSCKIRARSLRFRPAPLIGSPKTMVAVILPLPSSFKKCGPKTMSPQ